MLDVLSHTLRFYGWLVIKIVICDYIVICEKSLIEAIDFYYYCSIVGLVQLHMKLEPFWIFVSNIF